MDSLFSIFQLIVLIFSIVIHEYSHGAVADALGDPTAENEGRLTLNPIKHLDFFGSFLVPLFLFLASNGKFVFGWAKPVPYNPYNLRNQRWGSALVGLAGPIANLTVALILGLVLRYALTFENLFSGPLYLSYLYQSIDIIVVLNIVLAVFNLIPVPPLDGSKVLFAFLPLSLRKVEYFLEKYGLIIVLFLMFFGLNYILVPAVSIIYQILVGQRFFY